MDKEQAANWMELLNEEQKEKLEWLKDHRCSIEGSWAAPDPLHDLPSGLVLEVMVDKHAVVKVRSAGDKDIGGMFDHLYVSAKALLDWVDVYDAQWKGGTGE